MPAASVQTAAPWRALGVRPIDVNAVAEEPESLLVQMTPGTGSTLIAMVPVPFVTVQVLPDGAVPTVTEKCAPTGSVQ